MRLVYWKCCHSDEPGEDIRAKTKKAAKEARNAGGVDVYGEPFKVVVEYGSGFELLVKCMTDPTFEDYVASTDTEPAPAPDETCQSDATAEQ